MCAHRYIHAGQLLCKIFFLCTCHDERAEDDWQSQKKKKRAKALLGYIDYSVWSDINVHAAIESIRKEKNHMFYAFVLIFFIWIHKKWIKYFNSGFVD